MLAFVFCSDLVKLCLYTKVKVRIEQDMDIMNFLGKCEYFNRNSVNASCFNVSSRSAHVTHTLVLFSQLSQSLYLCLYLQSSGMVVLICLLGVGEIIWGLKFDGTKSATCALKFGADFIIWGLIFLVCYGPRHFLSIKFFRNWTADYFMS